MICRITTRRPSGKDVLAWDGPDVVDRLQGMAADHASGRHEDEIEQEARRGWAVLEPVRLQPIKLRFPCGRSAERGCFPV